MSNSSVKKHICTCMPNSNSLLFLFGVTDLMEKLVCDRCGIEYSDQASIQCAKKAAAQWRAILKRDGEVARGIAPCPIMGCRGELVLKE